MPALRCAQPPRMPALPRTQPLRMPALPCHRPPRPPQQASSEPVLRYGVRVLSVMMVYGRYPALTSINHKANFYRTILFSFILGLRVVTTYRFSLLTLCDIFYTFHFDCYFLLLSTTREFGSNLRIWSLVLIQIHYNNSNLQCNKDLAVGCRRYK
jgi:hypothetical protein